MAESIKSKAVAEEAIISKIYLIRGHKVMIDRDLAALYGVETRVLNQAVRRNERRFPEDFMFQLTEVEFQNLKSQFVISSWGGVRKLPFQMIFAALKELLNPPQEPRPRVGFRRNDEQN